MIQLFGKFYLKKECESAFSTVNFMKSKYRTNIFSENLASELKRARSINYQISELLQKK